jgi:hypothetical protein
MAKTIKSEELLDGELFVVDDTNQHGVKVILSSDLIKKDDEGYVHTILFDYPEYLHMLPKRTKVRVIR